MHPYFVPLVLNKKGTAECLEISKAFDELFQKIDDFLPAGRERSLVLAKLEEACMYARRANWTKDENKGELPPPDELTVPIR